MLWLIRHAESEGNAGAAASDFAAMGLTPPGQAQAERLATVLPARPDRVITSPYRRAVLTAAPALARWPGLEARERPVQEFTYLAADRCRGLTPAGLRPLVEAYWRRMDPAHVDGPGAESFAAFAARVRGFVAEVAGWPGTTLVFTHEQFIRATVWALLLGRFEGTAEDMVRFHALRSAFPVPNAAFLRVDLGADGPWLGRVKTDHLHGLDAAPLTAGQGSHNTAK
jgi:broad specificity phosphatase PhoE